MKTNQWCRINKVKNRNTAKKVKTTILETPKIVRSTKVQDPVLQMMNGKHSGRDTSKGTTNKIIRSRITILDKNKILNNMCRGQAINRKATRTKRKQMLNL